MRTTQSCHCRGRLTVDAERHPGIQFASLGHGPVPHDAAVRGPVVTAGWRQRQDRRSDGVSRIARPRLCLQRVGITFLVPPAHKAYCYIPHKTKQSAGVNMEQRGRQWHLITHTTLQARCSFILIVDFQCACVSRP